MRNLVVLISVVFIAACGANGEPVRPTTNSDVGASSPIKVVISGDAWIGVSF